MSAIKHNLSKLLTYLVYFFPLTFIYGNLLTNIFILLIIILGISVFQKDLIIWKDKLAFLLILSFFLLVIFSTLYQYFFFKTYPDWIKSILYLRFLLFLIVIKTMVQKKVLKLNNFINICFFIIIIICFDILLQYLIGFNLIGNNPINFPGMTYYTGFFNKELIAGGFILMFSLFGIFTVPISLGGKGKKLISISFLLLFILITISLILAGNRMPVIMFIIFAIILTFMIKNKEYKNKFLILSVIILIIGVTVIYNSSMIKLRFKSFVNGIPNPSVVLSEVKKSFPELEKYKNSGQIFSNIEEFKNSEVYKNQIPFFTGHTQIFITSIDLIIENPIFGSGIKSFRNNCSTKTHLPNRVCENHPHNFYLDIIGDTGLLGMSLIISSILILLIKVYKDYLKGNERKNNISDWAYLAVILSVIIQFFPFKSAGSFFSTFNSSYTFLILGFLIGLNELRYKKDK